MRFGANVGRGDDVAHSFNVCVTQRGLYLGEDRKGLMQSPVGKGLNVADVTEEALFFYELH